MKPKIHLLYMSYTPECDSLISEMRYHPIIFLDKINVDIISLDRIINTYTELILRTRGLNLNRKSC